MLSKEQVLEIISYCDTHGVTRRTRLMELGITHWKFYKSRRHHLDIEKSHPHECLSLKKSGLWVKKFTFAP